MIDELDLASMVADHAGLAGLCNALEALADNLPQPIAQSTIAALQSELENRLPTHDAREKALLRRLFGSASETLSDAAILDQIQCRRASCVVQALDLVSVFRGDGRAPAAETLGYMLRCFFQTCRQAMAFEELAILHCAGARLTPDARSLLIHSLMQRCGA